MVRWVAGQRAVGHEGGGAAAIQVNGIDHAVPLQEIGQLPQTHPAQTVQSFTWSAAGGLEQRPLGGTSSSLTLSASSAHPAAPEPVDH